MGEGEGEGRRKEKVGKVVGEREEEGDRRDEGRVGGRGSEGGERRSGVPRGIHGNIMNGGYRRKGTKDMSG